MKSLTIKRNLAFTMVEFAAVILIAGLIFMTVSPAVTKLMESAETDTAEQEIAELQAGIDDFHKENGRYPDSLEEVFGETPVDPWGNPYQYLDLSDVSGLGKMRKDKNLVPINSDYDLFSMGPDGKSVSPLTAESSQDDIVRGRNGLFIGVATDY